MGPTSDGATPTWCSRTRLAGDAIVLFDFGNAAKMHRLFELGTVLRSTSWQPKELRDELWTAFLDGYGETRALPDGFGELLPLARISSEIGFLEGNAATLPLRLGVEAVAGDFMARGVERVRRLVASSALADR